MNKFFTLVCALLLSCKSQPTECAQQQKVVSQLLRKVDLLCGEVYSVAEGKHDKEYVNLLVKLVVGADGAVDEMTRTTLRGEYLRSIEEKCPGFFKDIERGDWTNNMLNERLIEVNSRYDSLISLEYNLVRMATLQDIDTGFIKK